MRAPPRPPPAMRHQTHDGEGGFGGVTLRVGDNRPARSEERGEGGGGEEREGCRGEEVEEELADGLEDFRVAPCTFL